MWKRYFTFIKLVPGRVVTPRFGTIDFSSDNIPLETIKTLYEHGFPYLQITEQGKAELYGTTTQEAEIKRPAKTVKVKSRSADS
jgi:hypothetical protein